MSVYKYPESKVIDEITFAKTEKGTVRAYLHAHDGANPAALTDVIQHMQKVGWQCVPYTLDGKPALEVRGFSKESQLVESLQQKKWISGKANIQQTLDEKISFKDKIKKRSLQAAGALYAWGDASFVAYGWKGKSMLDVAAGIFYGLPTPVLIGYGKNDQSSLQIKDAARQLSDYLKKEGTNLPESCSLQSIVKDHKKGLINTTNELFQRYPSEFMNLCYSVAGACIFGAGMKHLKANHISPEAIKEWQTAMSKTKSGTTLAAAEAAAIKSMRTENYFNLGVGGTTFVSGLFGAFVKEKARDPDQPKKTGTAGMWEWVQSRPLTIAGAGFMVSTMLHAVSTAVAMKGHDSKHKESVWWRASFVTSALLAELMVAISSKGHGEGVLSDKSVDNSITSMAADLIVKQPTQRQEYLTENIGKFLGRPEVLATDDKVVTARLREQVEALRKNPWALCAPGKDGSPQVIAAQSGEKDDQALPQWQSRIAAESVPGQQPQLSS